jgi:hypothetical protein
MKIPYGEYFLVMHECDPEGAGEYRGFRAFTRDELEKFISDISRIEFPASFWPPRVNHRACFDKIEDYERSLSVIQICERDYDFLMDTFDEGVYSDFISPEDFL